MSKLKAIAGALAIASSVFISSIALAQPVTLDVFYTSPGFAKFHEPVAQEFMKRNPNIKIQFRAPSANYDEGHQVMLRQAITNQLPDVFYSGYHLLTELVQTLVKRNQIADLGPMLAAEPAAWRNANYSERILALGRVDGKLYGMAMNASTPITYYNEELVRKAGGDPAKFPDTWAGIIDMAKRIRAASPDVDGIAYTVHVWPDNWLWNAMILQDGGKLLNDTETAAAFGGDVGLKALRTFRRFVTDGGMQLIDFDQSRQQFAAGKIGIYFDTPARLRQITDMTGNRFTLRTLPFPIDNKANGGLPTGGNAAIITARDPAKQKAAWEYIKFVTGPEAQKIVVETTGYIPTNKRALEPQFLGKFYESEPNFRTVATQMDRSLPWQSYPGGNSVRIWRTQRDIITSVMRGETTPEAGIERLVSETNSLMK
ncbi:MAG TPA: ABC transporter substrate-binding protein [Casimicrobiaceae bacterium]|jgi:multiple sugar transport system substrate-binding protein